MKNINPATGAARKHYPEATLMVDSSAAKAAKPESFLATLINLEVGESAIKQSTITATNKLSTISEAITGWKDQLRNGLASTVAYAKRKTGGTYSVEVTELFTPSGRLFILAIITRTA